MPSGPVSSVQFSRTWTGFDLQPPRGNLEHFSGDDSDNVVDPMQIKPSWRDAFPKMDLHDNYVGDGYPLCAELPPRAFLRAGGRARATAAAHASARRLMSSLRKRSHRVSPEAVLL